jgi:uncharacterized protein (TIGR02145 family)
MCRRLLFITFLLLTSTVLFCQVSISSDNSPANPAAGLDVNFSNKGFLPPRLTQAQRNAITAPPDGLMVFCTDCSSAGVLQVFFSGKWHSQKFNGYPVVTGVAQNGYPVVNSVLTGIYTYTDQDNDPEGTSVYRWYRSDNSNGLNETLITGANSLTYVVQQSDLSKYFRFSVTPVAQSGDTPGDEVKSSVFQGPVTDFMCGSTIYDARDGKTYTSVKIGTQCWMQQNLNVGTQIPGTSAQTNNGVVEKFCYNNDVALCNVYGGLYSWDEMMGYVASSNLVPSGVKGICMTGWHVPSESEWCILMTYIDTYVNCNLLDWTGSTAGNSLKEAGTAHWSSPNAGSNSTGFTGLGAGGHNEVTYEYESLTKWGDIWSSTEQTTTFSRFWHLYWSHGDIYHYTWPKGRGISVRCVKD